MLAGAHQVVAASTPVGAWHAVPDWPQADDRIPDDRAVVLRATGHGMPCPYQIPPAKR
jgi:hypothetical protein